MYDDHHQQQVHFLVALLQCPAGALAQLVADSTSAVSTTLSRLVAATAAAAATHTRTLDQHAHARNDSTRPLLHAVIARLASHPKSNLPLPLLALYSHAFLESNHHLVTQNVVPDAFASSPKLAQELRATCGPALTDALNLDSAAADPLQAHIVLSLIRATAPSGPPSLLGPIVPRLVQTLNEAYPRLLGEDHRRLRLAVLETTHDLVQVAIRAVPAVVEALEPVLAQLLLATITPGTDSEEAQQQLARDLVSLYEPLGAQLAEAVQGAVGPVARNVKDQIARLRRLSASLSIGDDDWLADLRRAEAVGGAADPDVGIAKERQEPVTKMTANEDQMTARDAEGRNVNEADPAQVLSKADNEADLAQAVASLLDLFPSESPRFLRACLVDPTFTSDSGTSSLSVDIQLQRTTERVVEALLGEAQLPDRLLRFRFGQDDKDENEEDGDDGVAVNKVESLPSKPTKTSTTGAIERRNVYDDDKYFQRGTLLGPAASRARSTQTSNRIQLDERLKASIIALAERESSDEDDDDEERRYYDDDDFPGDEEGGAGTATPRIRIGAADEEPDENEQEGEERGGARGQRQQQQQQPRTPAAPSPYDPSTVLLLEQAYLRSPAVFARDSATRRGKARKDLRDRTKLGDEQIEGWKIMLEREPKKLQKLQDKHTDLAARANRPQHVGGADSADSAASSRNASPARASNHQQPPHLGGSRGGASSGRGGGGRGGGQGGDSANGPGHGQGQGQGQQKRSDGGRREHDRAKRGRDRKLARMGAGPPPA